MATEDTASVLSLQAEYCCFSVEVKTRNELENENHASWEKQDFCTLRKNSPCKRDLSHS